MNSVFQPSSDKRLKYWNTFTMRKLSDDHRKPSTISVINVINVKGTNSSKISTSIRNTTLVGLRSMKLR